MVGSLYVGSSGRPNLPGHPRRSPFTSPGPVRGRGRVGTLFNGILTSRKGLKPDLPGPSPVRGWGPRRSKADDGHNRRTRTRSVPSDDPPSFFARKEGPPVATSGCHPVGVRDPGALLLFLLFVLHTSHPVLVFRVSQPRHTLWDPRGSKLVDCSVASILVR